MRRGHEEVVQCVDYRCRLVGEHPVCVRRGMRGVWVVAVRGDWWSVLVMVGMWQALGQK